MAQDPRLPTREAFIQSLASLGLGVVVAGITFGSTTLSDDIRLLVLLGAIALLACGLFVGSKIGRRWYTGVLLCLPGLRSLCLFCFATARVLVADTPALASRSFRRHLFLS